MGRILGGFSDRADSGVFSDTVRVGDENVDQATAMRVLTDAELDEVAAGGAPYRGAPRVGTGSCFRWVSYLDQYWACNLLDAYGRPMGPPPSA